MRIIDRIIHRYWRMRDSDYNYVFTAADFYIENYETMGFPSKVDKTMIASKYASMLKILNQDLRYKSNKTGFYLNIYTYWSGDKCIRLKRSLANSDPWKRLSIEKTKFILEHFPYIFKTQEESMILARTKKLSKL